MEIGRGLNQSSGTITPTWLFVCNFHVLFDYIFPLAAQNPMRGCEVQSQGGVGPRAIAGMAELDMSPA